MIELLKVRLVAKLGGREQDDVSAALSSKAVSFDKLPQLEPNSSQRGRIELNKKHLLGVEAVCLLAK